MPFPKNPVTGLEFFQANQPTGSDNIFIFNKLEEILQALGGDPTAKALAEIQNLLWNSTDGEQVPAFEPSTFSIVNPAENTGTIEVTITTTAGDRTVTVAAGDTLTLPYIVGLVYEVISLVNNGETDAQYLGLLYA